MRWWITLVLTAFAGGALAQPVTAQPVTAQPATDQTAPEAQVDGGPDEAAGEATEDGTPGATTAEEVGEEASAEAAALAAITAEEARERARHRVAELEALLDGEPLPGSRFEALFSVDIRRPELRAEERARLRALQDIAELIAASSEEEVPGDLEAGVVDAGAVDAGVVDAGAADAGAVDARAVPSEAMVAAELGESDALADVELEALEARANQLRLDLLELPERELDVRLIALEARQSIDERIAESEAAAAEADEARRRAEEATERANADALAARNERERSIAENRALIQGERAGIAARLGEAARARQAGHEAEEIRLATIGSVQSAISDGDLSPARADELYIALVGVLIDTRQALRDALDHREELPMPASLNATGRETLRAEIEETRRARLEAQGTLQRLAREYVRALSSTLHDGNDLRLELLYFVSPARRDALVGFGSEGRAQLLREVGQLELMTRATGRRVREDAGTYPAQLWALATDTETRSTFFYLLGMMFGTVVLWRRREALSAYAERRISSSVGPRLWRGWVGRAFARLEAVLGSVIIITGTVVAMSIGRRLEFGTGFELAVHVSIAWGLYRLGVRLVTHELSARSSYVRSEERKPLEKSVRRIGRFVLVSYLLLDTSSGVVGQGTLYSYLFRFLALYGVVLGLVTFFRWRDAIDRYYLETHPDGRLVPAIKTGGVHVHLPATLAALGVITADWALETVQGLAGGFALGRRALAFFSERKVTSADASASSSDVGLPFELIPAPGACIDVYPEMKALIERAGSERGGAFALVGECGSGKTLWLEEAERKTSALSLVVPCECHDPDEFGRWLLKALGHDGTLETLAEELAGGPARTIFLDECQNLFLRQIGGLEPFTELATLVGRTQHRVVWCCSFSLHAWSYLRSAAAGQQMFESVVSLSGWTEEAVEEMCMKRVRQAGLKVDFGSMVDSALIGRPRGRAIQRAKEELFRLLWHYSGGNPRVALHYWQRSLQHSGDLRWSAKIFAKPDTEVLDKIHIETLFVLASVTLHKNLSPKELASTLRISFVRSVSLLQLLETRSLLICHEGRYHISTHWYREVIIRLRRRRLLFS
ncbi:MAG: hypothetical protein ACI9KE_002503 [Polyangiales bacterium]|jgi:hypothetical protein